MRLISLKIYKNINGEVIRNVVFNEYGLSFICDDDNEVGAYSGSSIGKTAFARCIDICLGSKSTKILYKGVSTGTNNELFGYIKENKISLELIIKDTHNNIHILVRNLFDNKEYIDGEEYKNINDYNAGLKKIFFPNSNDQISNRELMMKFVRIDSQNDLFKYNGNYMKTYKYHYAYYYFLQMFINKDENDMSNELIEKEKIITSYQNKYKIKNYLEFQKLVETMKQKVLDNKENVIKHDYIGDFERIDIENNILSSEINDVEYEIRKLQYRLDVLNRKIKREEDKKIEFDIDILKKLYDDALNIFDSKITSFEKFMEFHNEMCNLRLNEFISEKEKINHEILNLKDELDIKRKEFSTKFVNYKVEVNDKSGSFYEVYYNSKIEFNNAEIDLENYDITIKRINEIKQLLENFEEIKKNNDEIKDEISGIFRENTLSLLKQEYQLVFNDDIQFMPLSSNGVSGQVGTGDFNALICALDFSIYEYFIKNNIDLPYFIIQDQMESTPLNVLNEIFKKVRENGIQLILPILHDRIGTLDIKDNEIKLHLSKKNKLFNF